LKAERVGAIFWLGVGLISIYGSAQLGIGTMRGPGSGFLSLLAGCFISLMALIVLLQSLLRRQGNEAQLSSIWEGVKWRRPLAIGLILVAYILVLEKIGFLITSLVTLFVMFKGVEKISWAKAILISVSISAGSFLLFNNLLKATLPRGIFGF